MFVVSDCHDELNAVKDSVFTTVKHWYCSEVIANMERDHELLIIDPSQVGTETAVWRYYADTMTVMSHTEPLTNTRPDLAVRAHAFHSFGIGWVQAADWLNRYCKQYPDVLQGLEHWYQDLAQLEQWCANHTKQGKIDVSTLSANDTPLLDIDPLMVAALILQYGKRLCVCIQHVDYLTAGK